MLTSKDVRADMSQYLDPKEFEQDKFQLAVVIGIRLVLKLLLGMRVNQGLMMNKLGVEKIVPNQRKQNAEEVE